MMIKDLNNYRKDIYSQNGEDGIVEEILKRLKITRFGIFCEFGAWDGRYLSNTYVLVEQKGWEGIYIESDPDRYNDLLNTEEEYNNQITAINKKVEIEGDNSLDSILKQNGMPCDFDILSIDIDSYDYQIWKSLQNYQPKIVIIEVNSSIKPPIEQIHNPGKQRQGSSFTSTLNLGLKKGYYLVCHTGNMIFVRRDLVQPGMFENINQDSLFDPKFLPPSPSSL